MAKFIAVIFTAIITSFYFFPFEFTFLPGVNTKMAMAVVGIAISVYRLCVKRNTIIPKNVFIVSLLAGIVSLIGLVSITYNNTVDYAYASYLISMWVWLSAALVVCTLIERVHGKLSVPLICHYLIAVSVTQCMLALLIDFNPAVKDVVDTYISQDQEFLNKVERIYGIGAWLDVAGSRFSACLIMIAYLVYQAKEELTTKQIWAYFIAYAIIVVVGNMMARTTSVGIVVGIFFFAVITKPWSTSISQSSWRLLKNFLLLLAIAIPVVYVLYTTNDQFYKLFRFAFEAFFNYFEHGEFETSSTNTLQTMYVFPETFKTWLIGDGYFSSPGSDPYYFGKLVGGYYMGTDVGYLRFIFFFGVPGLIAFSSFIIYSAQTVMSKLPNYKTMFALLLLSNFMIWLKVATDLFLIFALFICVVNLREDEEENALQT